MNNRLAQLRDEKDLSQAQVGKIVNAAQNTVSQWEKGTRGVSSEVLIRLADFYKVSIDYLLGRTENRTTFQENIQSDITDDEIELIKKYRSLDDDGKRGVELILDHECARKKAGLNDKSSTTTA